MSRTKRPRAFSRDEQLSIRIPEDDKNRLKQIARQKRRDTSNLALEFICKGIAQELAGLQGEARFIHSGQ